MEKPAPDKCVDAIDIFVFSNGQQGSPPRKYHLTKDNLNQWDRTLNYLARSQYGPTHTNIHLRTLEGHEVLNSKQLKNGAAYVAVKPFEGFIEAGYDKYLMKASRSWEKSQKRNEVQNADGQREGFQTDDKNIYIPLDKILIVKQMPLNDRSKTPPSPRKSIEPKKTSLKTTSPRQTGLKPVANQVSQRHTTINRNLGSAHISHNIGKTILSKQEFTKKPTRIPRLGLNRNLAFGSSNNTTGSKLFPHSSLLHTSDNQNSKTKTSSLASSNITKPFSASDKSKITVFKRSDQSYNKRRNELQDSTNRMSLTDGNEVVINKLRAPISANAKEMIEEFFKAEHFVPESTNTDAVLENDHIAASSDDKNMSNRTDIISIYKDNNSYFIPNETFIADKSSKPIQLSNDLPEYSASNDGMLFEGSSYLKNIFDYDKPSLSNKTTQEMINLFKADFSDQENQIQMSKCQIPPLKPAATSFSSHNQRSFHKENEFDHQTPPNENILIKQLNENTDAAQTNLLLANEITPIPDDPNAHNDKTRIVDKDNLQTILKPNQDTDIRSKIYKYNKVSKVCETKLINDENFHFHEIDHSTLPEKDKKILNYNHEDIAKSIISNLVKSLHNDNNQQQQELENQKKLYYGNSFGPETKYHHGIDKDKGHAYIDKTTFHDIYDTSSKTESWIYQNQLKKIKIDSNPQINIDQPQVTLNKTDINITDQLILNLYDIDDTKAQSSDTENNNKICDINVYNFDDTEAENVSRLILRSPLTSKSSIANGNDTKHLVAVVHTGDIIKLQVNMELRTADGSLKAKRTINALGSDNDNNQNDEKKLNNNQISLNAASKSMQSIEDDIISHQCCRKTQKIVLKRCSCCEKFDIDNRNIRVYRNPLKTDQPYYLLMPLPPPGSSTEGCVIPTAEKQVQYTGTSSTINETIQISLDNVTESMTTEQSKHVAIVPLVDNKHTEVIVLSTQPSQTSNYACCTRKESVKSEACSVAPGEHKDASTQTDWSDILLEARVHSNGQYTFHLPPLATLRQYNI